MDSIQQQIDILTNKIDALHQIIEQINARVLGAISFQQTGLVEGDSYSQAEIAFMSPRLSSHRGLDAALEHKDVLSDSPYIEEAQSGNKELDTAIQIQRLTAQLTAAYNRIAALEEQLLARRTVH